MKTTNMLSAGPLEQPWWHVRRQLLATLLCLTTLGSVMWTNGPVRTWVARQVVQAEIPKVPLFAQLTR